MPKTGAKISTHKKIQKEEEEMVVVVTTTPFACPSSSFIQTLITPSSPSSAAAALFHHEFCFCIRIFSQQKKFLSPMVDFRPSIHSLLLHCSSAGGESSSSSSHHLTEIGHLFLFFQQIGIQEKETQILIDKNPKLLLVSIELLRGRVRSLSSIGIHGFSLCSLLTKRIEILTSEEIGPLLCFIKDDLVGGEMNPKKLLRLLSTTESRFFVGFVEKVGLLLDHGIPQDKLVHILNNVNLNKVFCHRSVEEIHKTIVFLIRVGGVELIVKRPVLLNFDLESQLIPRVNLFIELSGEDESAVGIVLRKLPAILTYSVEHMQGQVECLRSLVGLSDEEIFRIVKVYPNICSVSRERKLKPRIEFLIQCGLNRNDIYKFLTRAPLFMSLSFKGNLSKKLGILIKLGYKNRTKDFAIALGAVTRISSENMQNMIGVFLSYGFSYEDIFAMTKKHPNILQYSPKSLEKKMEYLVEDMGRDIRELLDFPAFLGYKLDGRIKHRHEVKKEMIGEGISINKLLNVSTENFLEKTSSSSTNIEHSLTGGRKKTERQEEKQ